MPRFRLPRTALPSSLYCHVLPSASFIHSRMIMTHEPSESYPSLQPSSKQDIIQCLNVVPCAVRSHCGLGPAAHLIRISRIVTRALTHELSWSYPSLRPSSKQDVPPRSHGPAPNSRPCPSRGLRGTPSRGRRSSNRRPRRRRHTSLPGRLPALLPALAVAARRPPHLLAEVLVRVTDDAAPATGGAAARRPEQRPGSVRHPILGFLARACYDGHLLQSVLDVSSASRWARHAADDDDRQSLADRHLPAARVAPLSVLLSPVPANSNASPDFLFGQARSVSHASEATAEYAPGTFTGGGRTAGYTRSFESAPAVAESADHGRINAGQAVAAALTQPRGSGGGWGGVFRKIPATAEYIYIYIYIYMGGSSGRSQQ
jgi:hypothetical protein